MSELPEEGEQGHIIANHRPRTFAFGVAPGRRLVMHRFDRYAIRLEGLECKPRLLGGHLVALGRLRSQLC